MTFVQSKIDEVLAYLGGTVDSSGPPSQEIRDENSNTATNANPSVVATTTVVTTQPAPMRTLHSQSQIRSRDSANSPNQDIVRHPAHENQNAADVAAVPQHHDLNEQVPQQSVINRNISSHVAVSPTTAAPQPPVAIPELPTSQTIAVNASPPLPSSLPQPQPPQQMLHKPNYRPVHNVRPPRIITEHFDLATYKVDSAHGYVEADCRHCSHTIKGQRNVTSNFIQHIKRKHVEAYEQFTANSGPRSKRPRLSSTPRTDNNSLTQQPPPPAPPPTTNSIVIGASPIPTSTVDLTVNTSAVQNATSLHPELSLNSNRVMGAADSVNTPPSNVLPITTTAPMNGVSGGTPTQSRTRPSGNHGMGRTNIRERIPVTNVVSSIQAAVSVTPDVTLEKSLVSPTYRGAIVTDCEYAAALSNRLKCHVYIKREDCQPTGSPVFRAAYNYIASTPISRSGVVVGMPSAPAVALAALKNNKPCIAYVPQHTPASVIRFLEKNGATVNVAGRTDLESCRLARSRSTVINRTYMDLAGKTLLTGYAEATAGYATLALEILQNLPMVNKVFMAAGNALMFSGVSAILQRLGRDVDLIGVQLIDECMPDDDLLDVDEVDSNELDDNVGAASGSDEKKWTRGRAGGGWGDDGIEQDFADEGDWGAFVAETVTVTRKEASAAVRSVCEDCEGLVLSPFGALSVAGAEKLWQKNQLQHQSFVCVVSDPLRDFDALRMVASDCFRYDAKHEFSIVDCSAPEVNSIVTLMAGLSGETENRPRVLQVEFDGGWPIKLGVAITDRMAYKTKMERMGFSLKEEEEEEQMNEMSHRGSLGNRVISETESIVAYSMRIDENGRMDVAQLLTEIGRCGEVRTVRYKRDGSGIARIGVSWSANGMRREVLEQEIRNRVMSYRRVL